MWDWIKAFQHTRNKCVQLFLWKFWPYCASCHLCFMAYWSGVDAKYCSCVYWEIKVKPLQLLYISKNNVVQVHMHAWSRSWNFIYFMLTFLSFKTAAGFEIYLHFFFLNCTANTIRNRNKCMHNHNSYIYGI